MEDEAPNAMNLNLNLGLNDNSSNDAEPEVGSFTHEALNSEYWLGDPISGISNAVRPRQRRREPWRPLWRQLQVSPGARNSALVLNDAEGSIGAEENKTCDKNDVFLDDELLGKEKGDEKGNYDTGSFFDCNICLDLASDPVVTCCGHLFCWTCIYKWLHFHSDAKECPVCKGEVSLKNVTPIYGRGESVIRQPIDDINLKIPNRPQAQRVDSWRQVMQRSEFNVQMEEVVLRRLVNRRLYRSRAESQHDDAPHESAERSNLQPNHVQAYRAIRIERNPEISHENVFDDLTERIPANSEAGESSQIPSAYYQRMNSNLAVVLSNLSTLRSADRVVESYLPNDTLERNQEPTQAVDDRDSMSSIAAVIQSESQTVDTPFDNDSTVLLSTSSSRRRNNASRISDVNSGDSRAPRRRRLN